MSQFVLYCRDKADSVALRMETREKHLAYLADVEVLLAGPMLNEADEPVGSVVIVEAPDLQAAKAIAENDPYAKAGLFESVEVSAYRAVLGTLAPA
ncbi:MAG: YciI family protein [Pseudomonadota bacterium]